MAQHTIPTENWLIIRGAIEQILNPKASKMRELENLLHQTHVRDLLFTEAVKVSEVPIVTPPPRVPSPPISVQNKKSAAKEAGESNSCVLVQFQRYKKSIRSLLIELIE